MTQLIKQILKDNGFDFISPCDIEGLAGDDLQERLQELVNEQEIIYYSRAIDYLKENDASLKESLEIAGEFGFPLDKLSSEVLATLLYQKNLSERIPYIISEIESEVAND